MNCPYCAAPTTKKRAKQTKLGYATFCCSTCQRTFNERTGTPFNCLEFPTDIVLLVVFWRLRYKLSLALPHKNLPFFASSISFPPILY